MMTANFSPRPVSGPGHAYGTHRAIAPLGALPQPAERISNDFSKLYDGELLLEVQTLNVDAASFRQMEEAVGSAAGVPAKVLETVAARGKQHNPVTGSGGMLLGRVLQVTPGHPGALVLKPGDRVATLVSLSLTPLRIDSVEAVRAVSAQLDVRGEAVLFASGPYALMPSDFSDRLALALFDVAGAAPQVARWTHPGQSVLVLGAGGKSGVLCAAEARRRVGPSGRVYGIENHKPFADELRALGLCDAVFEADARDPVSVRAAVMQATAGREVDVSFSCVNVEGAELGAILSTRDRGVVYFFAMSTSFTRAALGAEGCGKDVDLLIGNGYANNHADHTLELVRSLPAVAALFEARYG